jgi:hypothetical protein
MLRAVAVAAILSTVAHAEPFDVRWPYGFTDRWPERAPAVASSVRKVPVSTPGAAPEHPTPSVIEHKQKPAIARPRDGVDEAHRFEAAAWLGWGQPVDSPVPGAVAVWRNEAATVVRVAGNRRLVVASVSRAGATYLHERSTEGILGYRVGAGPAPVPALVRLLQGK